MRIGVVSDTHGDVCAVRAALQAAGHVELWLHLGDYVRDAALFAQAAPVYAVAGNCDLAAHEPHERIVTLEGACILMVHGDAYGVDGSLQRLLYRAQECGCQAALYGHTHASSVEYAGGVWLVNPGSPSRPRRQRPPSCAVLTLQDGTLKPQLIAL